MKQTTLCLLLKENEILLAMKKRSFGVGKWNGCGGKPEAGEDLINTVIREMQEEIGVQALAQDLEKVASLKFYSKTKVELNQEVNIFVCRTWTGTPAESEEMRPQWFTFDQIPFSQMWPDDKHWLPKILADKHLEGEFYFTEDGNDFEKFDLREI